LFGREENMLIGLSIRIMKADILRFYPDNRIGIEIGLRFPALRCLD
jgi:hypothetical protein